MHVTQCCLAIWWYSFWYRRGSGTNEKGAIARGIAKKAGNGDVVTLAAAAVLAPASQCSTMSDMVGSDNTCSDDGMPRT